MGYFSSENSTEVERQLDRVMLGAERHRKHPPLAPTFNVIFRTAKCWVALACLGPAIVAADDRFVVPARLHDRPARFALDTAAGVELAVWHETAERFGLEVRPPTGTALVEAGQMAPGWTQPTQVSFLGQTLTDVSLAVIDMPGTILPDVDGVIGWPALRKNILVLQVADRQVKIVGRVPAAAMRWQRLRLRDRATLVLTRSRPGGEEDSMLFDTGSTNGVKLAPDTWHRWQKAHPARASTMVAYYKPGAGLVVEEESWAAELAIGDMVMHDVPVMEADVTDRAAVGPGYAASLGLAAMSRLDLVVDGAHGVAYARPSPSPPPKYPHNRLGAVFVPRDAQSDDLVATVAERSPAAAAGIRNGDVLLKIDRLDVTPFRTQPGILPLSRFWNQPAATKMDLELRRGSATFRVTVELKDLLGAERNHEAAQ